MDTAEKMVDEECVSNNEQDDKIHQHVRVQNGASVTTTTAAATATATRARSVAQLDPAMPPHPPPAPLATAPGQPAVLKPEIANVIRAGYDPVMPASANDPSHGLRLAARVGALGHQA